MRLIITCTLLLSIFISGICNSKFYDKMDITERDINDVKMDTLFNEKYVPLIIIQHFLDSTDKSISLLAGKIDSINSLVKNKMNEIKFIQSNSFSRLKTLYIVNLLLIILLILAIIFILIYFKKKRRFELNREKDKYYDNPSKQIDENKRDLAESFKDEEIDHSLSICVGTEIYRMRKRIGNMDAATKGLNALNNALMRLEEELKKQGYAINDITGQNYSDELTVKIINSIVSEDVMPGKSIISKMVKPQIVYKGAVISHGEAEIAISPHDK
ncbi:MAG: hypothetical protein ACFFDN_37135 [Candidatus Hodarchaeota archaeon]